MINMMLTTLFRHFIKIEVLSPSSLFIKLSKNSSEAPVSQAREQSFPLVNPCDAIKKLIALIN
jgi:hypothetical protein